MSRRKRPSEMNSPLSSSKLNANAKPFEPAVDRAISISLSLSCHQQVQGTEVQSSSYARAVSKHTQKSSCFQENEKTQKLDEGWTVLSQVKSKIDSTEESLEPARIESMEDTEEYGVFARIRFTGSESVSKKLSASWTHAAEEHMMQKSTQESTQTCVLNITGRRSYSDPSTAWNSILGLKESCSDFTYNQAAYNNSRIQSHNLSHKKRQSSYLMN